MKIAIDIRTACAEKKAGKGWYTFHLVKALLQEDKKNEYVLYTDRQTTQYSFFKNVSLKLIKKQGIWWHVSALRDWVKIASSEDVFFAPTSFLIPTFLPRRLCSVITVFDLVAFMWSKGHQAKATIVERLFLPYAIKKTRHILVPSKNTQRDLERLFPKAASKIVLTPLATTEDFFKKATQEDRLRVQTTYHLPEKFILSVGTLEPRKNLSLLVDAVSEMHSRSHPMPLVVIGAKGWKSSKLEEKLNRFKEHIHLIPFCTPADLPIIYQLATIFVFPSLYEGFGLPPLEAMASGCPVLCSRAGSLPEVVGDAALLFDPRDKKMLIQHLEKVLDDTELRRNLALRGIHQARRFSWEITARNTLHTLTGD